MPNAIAATDLITSSMRLISAIATGETPNDDEISDGLLVLNDMLENWSTERLSVWGQADQVFNLVAGQSAYTIGPGGNFNTVRPVRISGAFSTVLGVDFPIDIITQQEYNEISLKTAQQQIVEKLVYVNDAPLGRITLYPPPSGVVPITLSLDRVLTTPVVAATQLIGPPGFTKALRFCLAAELAPEYGTSPPDMVLQVAADAKADFKRANSIEWVMSSDPAVCSPQRATWQEGY